MNIGRRLTQIKKNPLTEQVPGTIFEVANALGAGFLEKVYERAPLKELAIRGFRVKSQVPTGVKYKGQSPGEYFADLLVEDFTGGRTEMCRTIRQRAHGPMRQLPQSLRAECLSSSELPEA
jgi:hypothetical protein